MAPQCGKAHAGRDTASSSSASWWRHGPVWSCRIGPIRAGAATAAGVEQQQQQLPRHTAMDTQNFWIAALPRPQEGFLLSRLLNNAHQYTLNTQSHRSVWLFLGVLFFITF